MAAGRRTRITIETERTLIIARQRATRGWCKECGREVEFVQQDQAGSLVGPLFERPGGWSKNKIHLEQAKDGLSICLKSLLRFLQSASGQPGSH